MRVFEINRKDVARTQEYLWSNGYHPDWDDNSLIASEDEDIEIKTILDDEGVEYTERNLILDEALLEISSQLDMTITDGEEPTAYITLVSGRVIEVTFNTVCGNSFFMVRVLDSNGGSDSDLYMKCTKNCTIDDRYLISDYIDEILEYEESR